MTTMSISSFFRSASSGASRAAACLLAVLSCAGSAVAASPSAAAGMATIVDGESSLVRDISRYRVEEGLNLQRDDIIETSPQSRLLRLEMQDGTLFDLGPATKVMIEPVLPTSRTRVVPRLYLLQGWVKWTAGKAPGAVVSASMDVHGSSRSVVLSVASPETVAFAETGEWTVLERRGVKSVTSTSIALKQEQFYQRDGDDDRGKLLDRPTPVFLKNIPHAFIDTLPPRRERLVQAQEVTPKRLGDTSYSEIQPWLNSETALRRQFIPRWRAKATEPDFQKGLQSDMALHPEWDPVLNPHKFQPRNPTPKTRLGNPGLTLQ